ncbi:hypothetical protein DAI22_03g183100 [Oryza sativa Japonica Group]|nr:hypothetical protein DAI22_03g183100 [Oryza sativa Japonica Group]
MATFFFNIMLMLSHHIPRKPSPPSLRSRGVRDETSPRFPRVAPTPNPLQITLPPSVADPHSSLSLPIPSPHRRLPASHRLLLLADRRLQTLKPQALGDDAPPRPTPVHEVTASSRCSTSPTATPKGPHLAPAPCMVVICGLRHWRGLEFSGGAEQRRGGR